MCEHFKNEIVPSLVIKNASVVDHIQLMTLAQCFSTSGTVPPVVLEEVSGSTCKTPGWLPTGSESKNVTHQTVVGGSA